MQSIMNMNMQSIMNVNMQSIMNMNIQFIMNVNIQFIMNVNMEFGELKMLQYSVIWLQCEGKCTIELKESNLSHIFSD